MRRRLRAKGRGRDPEGTNDDERNGGSRRRCRQGGQASRGSRQRSKTLLIIFMEPHHTLSAELFEAARAGDAAFIVEHAAKVQTIDPRDAHGYTPLIIAAYNGHLEAAVALLDAGADVNAQDYGGNTALMGVCFKGYPEIAELLVRRGADLDVQHGNGGTALMFAVMFGRNELVKVMLRHGADTNLREGRG